jgi:hypothetical protein
MSRLTPPDIEATLVAILADELDVPAYSQVPRDRQSGSDPFVVVRRLGGVRGSYVTDEPMVTIEAWAPDRSDAFALCAEACDVLFDLPGTVTDGVTFYRTVETSGPTNLPDPDSQMPRYTSTLLVRVRGVETLTSV